MPWRKWPPWQKGVQKKPYSKRVKGEGERRKSIVGAINRVAYELETNRQKQSATDPDKGSREKWSLIGLLITAGVALLALVLSIYQTWDTRKGFEADHRAWIAPQHAWSKAPIAATDLDLNIQLFNTGRQPATDVTSYVGWYSFPGTDPEDTKFTDTLDDVSKKCRTMPQTKDGVLYPSTGNTSYTIVAKTPSDVIDTRIVGGGAMLAIYGCVAYRTFEAIHHSNFCVYYQATKMTPDNWGFCTVGNYAD